MMLKKVVVRLEDWINLDMHYKEGGQYTHIELAKEMNGTNVCIVTIWRPIIKTKRLH